MEELDAVYSALQKAKLYGLESEVVVYSLRAMKNDSTLSIERAIQMGLSEWVK